MKTPMAESIVEQRRKFISEAFHSFHQPMTALHCGLEITLLKERSAEDYRARTQDCLSHAGAILELNRAVRELVEASDPGEDFGPVELAPLLNQLASDLAIPGDAAMISVRVECPQDIHIAGSASILARTLGNLASQLMRSGNPHARLNLVAIAEKNRAEIALTLDGKRREPETGTLRAKLDQIRLDAACSYAWTLKGELFKTKTGFVLSLPLLD